MRLVLLLISLFFFVGKDSYAQNYVTLYADCNYVGTSLTLDVGSYSLGQTRIGYANLSSFRLPQGYKITLYNGNQPGQGNQKITFTGGTTCLTSSGWNNKANSILIERINDNGNNGSSIGNYVTLYADCNYRGKSKSFGEGNFSLNELGIGDDQLSSINIPAGWSITIFQDPYQKGNSLTYNSNIACLPIGWNNRTSSISVRQLTDNNNNTSNIGVTLFSDCNYRGTKKSLTEGRFNWDQMGVGDDELSSILVPTGWSITIYQDPNQRGNSITYNAAIACLPTGWNNRTSSVLIRRLEDNTNNANNIGVTLFSDCNYRGINKSLKEGRYNWNQMGIDDDELSSIIVPTGWSIILYQDLNQRGNSIRYNAGIACLPTGWNNRTSSVIVQRLDNNNNNNNNIGVTLFSDCNFRGTNKSFREGSYSLSQLGIGDNELSSIRVPQGWSITIYTNPYQQGSSMTYNSDITCLPTGWNNNTSSIVVRRLNDNGNNGFNGYNSSVTVFADCNYRGNYKTFSEGRYSMYELGLGNERISSIKVAKGWSVIIYQNPNYTGTAATVNNDYSCLPTTWNDRISSIWVRRTY